MNEIAAARSSIGISGDGKGVSGARRSGIPRCVEPPILGFAGLASDNRSIAGALNALIAALCVGMFMRQETNGESRVNIRRIFPEDGGSFRERGPHLPCIKQAITVTLPNVRHAVAGVAVAAFLLPAQAARSQEWSGSATIYGWLTWLDLESSPDDGRDSIDVSLSLKDILEALKFAFFASGEVHYGRVGILQDFVYANLGFDGRLDGPFASKVDIDQKMFLSTTALGYQVYAEDGVLIEPYAGARYVSSKTDLTIKGGGPRGIKVKGFVDVDWWDPVIGVRGRMPLSEKLDATGFADIGGFGVGSKFSWEIFGGLDYGFTESVSANAGFRYLSIDYDASSTDVKMEIYGPTVGLTLRF